MPGKLYLVATPIGNLGDISPRAIETLSAVGFIAAEDTRVCAKLLTYFGIKKPVMSYYEHNLRERGEMIVGRIAGGEDCALVSDAGTPAISDPGEDLVRLCAEAGIDTVIIPGPCAAVSALALSGLPTGRFVFEGFLSANRRNRRQRLIEIRNDRRTLIFYESPHKLKTTLGDMLEILGDRRICLAREMTKLHEETVRTTLAAACGRYSAEAPRGEFALVVEGAADEAEHPETLTARESVEMYVSLGMTRTEAVKAAAKERGLKKNEVYKLFTADAETAAPEKLER